MKAHEYSNYDTFKPQTHGLNLEKTMSISVPVTSLPVMPESLQSLLNFLLSSSFPADKSLNHDFKS